MRFLLPKKEKRKKIISLFHEGGGGLNILANFPIFYFHNHGRGEGEVTLFFSWLILMRRFS